MVQNITAKIQYDLFDDVLPPLDAETENRLSGDDLLPDLQPPRPFSLDLRNFDGGTCPSGGPSCIMCSRHY